MWIVGSLGMKISVKGKVRQGKRKSKLGGWVPM